MNCTRTLVLAWMLGSCSQAAFGTTPQVCDKLFYGDHKFAIFEVPMCGLWHYGEDAPPLGKSRPPEFDFESTGNWAGYRATWEICESRLFLRNIRARVDGKKVRNEEILQGKKFPTLANWFTGKIHLPVGDLDPETGEYEAVVVFEIDGGHVTSMTFSPSLQLPNSWNGL